MVRHADRDPTNAGPEFESEHDPASPISRMGTSVGMAGGESSRRERNAVGDAGRGLGRSVTNLP
jgi:hypothetical protein